MSEEVALRGAWGIPGPSAAAADAAVGGSARGSGGGGGVLGAAVRGDVAGDARRPYVASSAIGEPDPSTASVRGKRLGGPGSAFSSSGRVSGRSREGDLRPAPLTIAEEASEELIPARRHPPRRGARAGWGASGDRGVAASASPEPEFESAKGRPPPAYVSSARSPAGGVRPRRLGDPLGSPGGGSRRRCLGAGSLPSPGSPGSPGVPAWVSSFGDGAPDAQASLLTVFDADEDADEPSPGVLEASVWGRGGGERDKESIQVPRSKAAAVVAAAAAAAAAAMTTAVKTTTAKTTTTPTRGATRSKLQSHPLSETQSRVPFEAPLRTTDDRVPFEATPRALGAGRDFKSDFRSVGPRMLSPPSYDESAGADADVYETRGGLQSQTTSARGVLQSQTSSARGAPSSSAPPLSVSQRISQGLSKGISMMVPGDASEDRRARADASGGDDPAAGSAQAWRPKPLPAKVPVGRLNLHPGTVAPQPPVAPSSRRQRAPPTPPTGPLLASSRHLSREATGGMSGLGGDARVPSGVSIAGELRISGVPLAREREREGAQLKGRSAPVPEEGGTLSASGADGANHRDANHRPPTVRGKADATAAQGDASKGQGAREGESRGDGTKGDASRGDRTKGDASRGHESRGHESRGETSQPFAHLPAVAGADGSASATRDSAVTSCVASAWSRSGGHRSDRRRLPLAPVVAPTPGDASSAVRGPGPRRPPAATRDDAPPLSFRFERHPDPASVPFVDADNPTTFAAAPTSAPSASRSPKVGVSKEPFSREPSPAKRPQASVAAVAPRTREPAHHQRAHQAALVPAAPAASGRRTPADGSGTRRPDAAASEATHGAPRHGQAKKRPGFFARLFGCGAAGSVQGDRERARSGPAPAGRPEASRARYAAAPPADRSFDDAALCDVPPPSLSKFKEPSSLGLGRKHLRGPTSGPERPRSADERFEAQLAAAQGAGFASEQLLLLTDLPEPPRGAPRGDQRDRARQSEGNRDELAEREGAGPRLDLDERLKAPLAAGGAAGVDGAMAAPAGRPRSPSFETYRPLSSSAHIAKSPISETDPRNKPIDPRTDAGVEIGVDAKVNAGDNTGVDAKVAAGVAIGAATVTAPQDVCIEPESVPMCASPLASPCVRPDANGNDAAVPALDSQSHPAGSVHEARREDNGSRPEAHDADATDSEHLENKRVDAPVPDPPHRTEMSVPDRTDAFLPGSHDRIDASVRDPHPGVARVSSPLRDALWRHGALEEAPRGLGRDVPQERQGSGEVGLRDLSARLAFDPVVAQDRSSDPSRPLDRHSKRAGTGDERPPSARRVDPVVDVAAGAAVVDESDETGNGDDAKRVKQTGARRSHAHASDESDGKDRPAPAPANASAGAAPLREDPPASPLDACPAERSVPALVLSGHFGAFTLEPSSTAPEPPIRNRSSSIPGTAVGSAPSAEDGCSVVLAPLPSGRARRGRSRSPAPPLLVDSPSILGGGEAPSPRPLSDEHAAREGKTGDDPLSRGGARSAAGAEVPRREPRGSIFSLCDPQHAQAGRAFAPLGSSSIAASCVFRVSSGSDHALSVPGGGPAAPPRGSSPPEGASVSVSSPARREASVASPVHAHFSLADAPATLFASPPDSSRLGSNSPGPAVGSPRPAVGSLAVSPRASSSILEREERPERAPAPASEETPKRLSALPRGSPLVDRPRQRQAPLTGPLRAAGTRRSLGASIEVAGLVPPPGQDGRRSLASREFGGEDVQRPLEQSSWSHYNEQVEKRGGSGDREGAGGSENEVVGKSRASFERAPFEGGREGRRSRSPGRDQATAVHPQTETIVAHVRVDAPAVLNCAGLPFAAAAGPAAVAAALIGSPRRDPRWPVPASPSPQRNPIAAAPSPVKEAPGSPRLRRFAAQFRASCLAEADLREAATLLAVIRAVADDHEARAGEIPSIPSIDRVKEELWKMRRIKTDPDSEDESGSENNENAGNDAPTRTDRNAKQVESERDDGKRGGRENCKGTDAFGADASGAAVSGADAFEADAFGAVAIEPTPLGERVDDAVATTAAAHTRRRDGILASVLPPSAAISPKTPADAASAQALKRTPNIAGAAAKLRSCSVDLEVVHDVPLVGPDSHDDLFAAVGKTNTTKSPKHATHILQPSRRRDSAGNGSGSRDGNGSGSATRKAAKASSNLPRAIRSRPAARPQASLQKEAIVAAGVREALAQVEADENAPLGAAPFGVALDPNADLGAFIAVAAAAAAAAVSARATAQAHSIEERSVLSRSEASPAPTTAAHRRVAGGPTTARAAPASASATAAERALPRPSKRGVAPAEPAALFEPRLTRAERLRREANRAKAEAQALAEAGGASGRRPLGARLRAGVAGTKPAPAKAGDRKSVTGDAATGKGLRGLGTKPKSVVASAAQGGLARERLDRDGVPPLARRERSGVDGGRRRAIDAHSGSDESDADREGDARDAHGSDLFEDGSEGGRAERVGRLRRHGASRADVLPPPPPPFSSSPSFRLASKAPPRLEIADVDDHSDDLSARPTPQPDLAFLAKYAAISPWSPPEERARRAAFLRVLALLAAGEEVSPTSMAEAKRAAPSLLPPGFFDEDAQAKVAPGRGDHSNPGGPSNERRADANPDPETNKRSTKEMIGAGRSRRDRERAEENAEEGGKEASKRRETRSGRREGSRRSDPPNASVRERRRRHDGERDKDEPRGKKEKSRGDRGRDRERDRDRDRELRSRRHRSRGSRSPASRSHSPRHRHTRPNSDDSDSEARRKRRHEHRSALKDRHVRREVARDGERDREVDHETEQRREINHEAEQRRDTKHEAERCREADRERREPPRRPREASCERTSGSSVLMAPGPSAGSASSRTHDHDEQRHREPAEALEKDRVRPGPLSDPDRYGYDNEDACARNHEIIHMHGRHPVPKPTLSDDQARGIGNAKFGLGVVERRDATQVAWRADDGLDSFTRDRDSCSATSGRDATSDALRGDNSFPPESEPHRHGNPPPSPHRHDVLPSSPHRHDVLPSSPQRRGNHPSCCEIPPSSPQRCDALPREAPLPSPTSRDHYLRVTLTDSLPNAFTSGDSAPADGRSFLRDAAQSPGAAGAPFRSGVGDDPFSGLRRDDTVQRHASPNGHGASVSANGFRSLRPPPIGVPGDGASVRRVGEGEAEASAGRAERVQERAVLSSGRGITSRVASPEPPPPHRTALEGLHLSSPAVGVDEAFFPEAFEGLPSSGLPLGTCRAPLLDSVRCEQSFVETVEERARAWALETPHDEAAIRTDVPGPPVVVATLSTSTSEARGTTSGLSGGARSATATRYVTTRSLSISADPSEASLRPSTLSEASLRVAPFSQPSEPGETCTSAYGGSYHDPPELRRQFSHVMMTNVMYGTGSAASTTLTALGRDTSTPTVSSRGGELPTRSPSGPTSRRSTTGPSTLGEGVSARAAAALLTWNSIEESSEEASLSPLPYEPLPSPAQEAAEWV